MIDICEVDPKLVVAKNLKACMFSPATNEKSKMGEKKGQTSQKHTLKEQGYGCVSINIPVSLWDQVEEYVETVDATKMDFFDYFIRDFLRCHPGPNIHYLATRRNYGTRLLAMWIKPELFTALKQTAVRDHITLRAICFTALVYFLENLDQSTVFGRMA